MNNALYFILISFFVLKIFKTFFVLKGKQLDDELDKKQLQETYCQISQKVKSTRQ